VASRASLGSESEARSFAAEIPGAYVFATDEFASMTPGYWVVAVGRYASAEEALGYCQDNGLYAAHDCVALPVSQDPGDRRIRPSLEDPG
jgi:hypothetical protein